MTMNRLPKSLSRPAARASEHGLDIVTINAGQNENTQVFKIHKDLLCKASHFFKSTFNGQYLESKTGCLELTTIDPITVEVLYQWLYTGSIRDVAGFASESNVDIDLLWLRVFTMAHQYMINELQEVSYYCFRKTFHDFHIVLPSLACVRELYESNLPTNLADMLKSYLLLHCAYWIMDESCSCWECQDILNHPTFGADIAWELTKRRLQDYVRVQSHPRYNVKFANHNGRVFVKGDGDDEEKLQGSVSPDVELAQDRCSSTSERGWSGDDTEAVSD